jgi:hypothetical protein
MVKRVSNGPQEETENFGEMTYDELREVNTIINFSITDQFTQYLASLVGLRRVVCRWCSKQQVGSKKKGKEDIARQDNIIRDFLDELQFK